jgi:hypothetical protein
MKALPPDTLPTVTGQEHNEQDERERHSFIEFYNRFFGRYTFEEFVLDTIGTYRLADEDAAGIRALLLDGGTPVTELGEMLLGLVASAEADGAEAGRRKQSSKKRSPALLRKALNCFVADRVPGGCWEALFSIRIGGISTRTIRNWKKDGAIYSAGSSKALNDLFDRLLPPDAPISRKRLAWLWLAERLKLDDAETGDFLKTCMNEQSIYALDLYETVLRIVISVNSHRAAEHWGFIDAISFCLSLQKEIVPAAFPWQSSRDKILEALRQPPDGDALALADNLSLIYEEIAGYLRRLDGGGAAGNGAGGGGSSSSGSRVMTGSGAVTGSANANARTPHFSQDVVFTRTVEDAYLGSFRSTFTSEGDGGTAGSLPELQDIKTQITQWARDNRFYLQTAYLSGLLTVVRLLIEFAVSVAKTNDEHGLFELFYFNASRAVTAFPEGEHPAKAAFPENVAEMASILLYEEGVAFGRFAREKCLTYFERMLEVPSRLSRRRLIEFYLLTQMQNSRRQSLDLLLARHHFRELGEGDEALLHFFETCTEDPPKTAARFAEALAVFRQQGLCPPGGKTNWPVQEKLFRWKHGLSQIL